MKSSLLLFFILLFVGCSNSEPPQHLEIYCAASLAEPVRALTKRWEEKYPEKIIHLQVGGSHLLYMQIQQGAKPDLFLSADPEWTQKLEQQGWGKQSQLPITNSMVLIAPRGNNKVQAPKDLLKKDVKWVVGQKNLPAGKHARKILNQMGAWKEASYQIVSQEEDVKKVLGKILWGEVDAGWVYRTDALPYQDSQIRIIEMPKSLSNIHSYSQSEYLKGNEEAVSLWNQLFYSPESLAIFKEKGFSLPE